jgi:hypothetical protein
MKNPDTGDRICAPHALGLGLLAKLGGVSKEACAFFDGWFRETGEEIPHVHFTGDGTVTGSEVGGLVPCRRFKPDGYVEDTREAWWNHGDWYHGYPPWHHKHECFVHREQWGPDVYKSTLDMMQLFADQGMLVKYIWGSDYKYATKHGRSLASIVRTLDTA